MSLTYGYDLKDGDKILEAPVQVGEIMSPLLLPGGALVNHVSFCAPSNSIHSLVIVPHSYLQCGISLHGSHTSATNHWRE